MEYPHRGIRDLRIRDLQGRGCGKCLAGASIRRECQDHVIVWNQRSLRRILQNYFAYYQHSRPHLALDHDTPEPMAVEPVEQGRVLAIPQVGGLHHRYQRCAA